MSNWVGLIHVMSATLFAFYGLLFKKNKLDLIYLFIMYFLLLHWTFFNGECVISYVVKLQENPDYKAGENAKNTDMEEIYPNEFLKTWVPMIMNITWVISIYLVFLRNKIGSIYCGIFLYLYVIYKLASKYMLPHNTNSVFLHTQEITKYSLILYGIFFLPILFKRVMK